MAQAITEEQGVHKEWAAQAKDQTLETLPEFLRHLTEDYEHDYGTICHAIAAAAVGAAWAVEHSPQGGITGFQAGAIMWEFMQHWSRIEGPARLLDYNELIYPQYEHKFREISAEAWGLVQEKARETLAGAGEDDAMHPDVRAHMESVAAGQIPFGLKLEAENS